MFYCFFQTPSIRLHIQANKKINNNKINFNRFTTGHMYNGDHCDQTSVAKMATNKKIITVHEQPIGRLLLTSITINIRA